MNSLARIDRFVSQQAPPTPCVIIDLATVRQRFDSLRALFADARSYYAVKANPAAAVINSLAGLDIGFDLASTGEIDRCRAQRIDTARGCFGNTVKR